MWLKTHERQYVRNQFMTRKRRIAKPRTTIKSWATLMVFLGLLATAFVQLSIAEASPKTYISPVPTETVVASESADFMKNQSEINTNILKWFNTQESINGWVVMKLDDLEKRIAVLEEAK